MQDLFICPQCQSVYHDVVFGMEDIKECPICKVDLRALNVDQTKWKTMTDQEKETLKEQISKIQIDQSTIYLKHISRTLTSIKNIGIFFIVGFILLIFAVIVTPIF